MTTVASRRCSVYLVSANTPSYFIYCGARLSPCQRCMKRPLDLIADLCVWVDNYIFTFMYVCVLLYWTMSESVLPSFPPLLKLSFSFCSLPSLPSLHSFPSLSLPCPLFPSTPLFLPFPPFSSSLPPLPFPLLFLPPCPPPTSACCRCCVCSVPLPDRYFEQDGKAYCQEDLYKTYAHTCAKCSEIISGPVMVSWCTYVCVCMHACVCVCVYVHQSSLDHASGKCVSIHCSRMTQFPHFCNVLIRKCPFPRVIDSSTTCTSAYVRTDIRTDIHSPRTSHFHRSL